MSDHQPLFFLYHHRVGIFPRCCLPEWTTIWDRQRSWHIEHHRRFGWGPKQCPSAQGGEPACLGDDAPRSGDALATPLLSRSVSWIGSWLWRFLGPLDGQPPSDLGLTPLPISSLSPKALCSEGFTPLVRVQKIFNQINMCLAAQTHQTPGLSRYSRCTTQKAQILPRDNFRHRLIYLFD